jgi:hypothetical protein
VGKPAVDTKKGKVWESAFEAVQDVKPGSFVLSSGTFLHLSLRPRSNHQVSDYVVLPKLSFML